MISVFKTEVVHCDGTRRSFEDIEMATLEWVACFNQVRVLYRLGFVRSAEFESEIYNTVLTLAAPCQRVSLDLPTPNPLTFQ